MNRLDDTWVLDNSVWNSGDYWSFEFLSEFILLCENDDGWADDCCSLECLEVWNTILLDDTLVTCLSSDNCFPLDTLLGLLLGKRFGIDKILLDDVD